MTSPPTTRASLLLKLCDPQDQEAWREFVEIYEPAIYRLLKRSGLQEADALEVMQELLWAVSRSIDRWKPGPERGSFRGWLRRVARNLVVSWVRRNQRRIVSSSLELEGLAAEEEPIEGQATREFDGEVQRALFRRASELVRVEVRPKTWQAFWEVAVVGRSMEEVATQLGMSVGGVRVAKCRVTARLREAVEKLKESV